LALLGLVALSVFESATGSWAFYRVLSLLRLPPTNRQRADNVVRPAQADGGKQQLAGSNLGGQRLKSTSISTSPKRNVLASC
jgi:hypothetical protein